MALSSIVTLLVSVCLLILIISLIVLVITRQPGNLPPGPPGYPIVGNLFDLSGHSNSFIKFYEFAQRYGSIFLLKVLGVKIVLLADFELINEALIRNQDIALYRPYAHIPYIKKLFQGRGILAQNGPVWKNSRWFALVAMRECGFGNAHLEEKICTEIQAFKAAIKTENGKAFTVGDGISRCLTNIMCQICFNKRYDYNDQFLQEFYDMFNLFVTEGGMAMPEVRYRILIYNPCGKGRKVIANENKMREIIGGLIAEHRTSFDPQQAPQDFIDLYLKAESDSDHELYNVITEDDVFPIILDMFRLGTDTVGHTLSWAMVYLLHNPQVQERCQEEIGKVIGTDRLPSMKDKLPYVEAIVNETLRMGPVTPSSAPQKAERDTTLSGYFIPAGSVVAPLLYTIHHDSNYWDEPFEFRPERWLDDNGQLIKHDNFLPFGTGARACVGYQLAKMEVRLFLACLLQEFTFSVPPNTEPPPLVGVEDTLNKPLPFQVCAKQN